MFAQIQGSQTASALPMLVAEATIEIKPEEKIDGSENGDAAGKAAPKTTTKRLKPS
jgi:hypothetical protein